MSISPTSSRRNWAQNLYQRFIAAHPAIQAPDERRKAELLAGLALGFLTVTGLGLLASWLTTGVSSFTLFFGFAFLLIALFSYLLSRTPRYQRGAYLLIISFALLSYLAALFDQAIPALTLLLTLSLTFLLANLLDLRQMLALIGVNLALVTGFTLIFLPQVRGGVLITTVFGLFTTGLFVLLFAWHRQSLEQLRLNEILKAQASLEQSNLELQSAQRAVNARLNELSLAAEVGRAVSQVRELDVMLEDAVEIIRSRFDLYYTQVYLTDPSQTALVLEAGTGTVGAELLARGHRLPLDSGSINGRAALEKRPVVITDTASSPVFKPNPLLPETRSEMAVPLMIGERVIGVLDMQSRRPGALSEEALPAFEALAGQLAIAIQNASLLAEAEEARREVEKQARRLARANWQEYLDALHKPERLGFVFEAGQVKPLEEQTIHSPAEGQALSAPIAVSGEALGALAVELDAPNKTPQTTELVNAVARQVAQQIESLRLLESAERYRLQAEQAARRLTREGWQAYFSARANQPLGYLYDSKAIQPLEAQSARLKEAGLIVPVRVRDETIGSLAVFDVAPSDSEALELVSQVSERLSAHIESLRQYDRAQSALAQTEKLFEASRVLTQAQDLQELTASTVKMLGIPEINRAVLTTFNYDSDGNINSFDIIANWWNGTGHQVTPIGTRYTSDVIRVMPMFISPTPIFSNDTFTDERVDATTMQVLQRLNLRALAVLPLFSGTRQIGALILQAEEPHNFSQEETRLFSALAPQIATVVENRRQFAQAQKQAERQALLNAISQKIQSATSVEAVLQIAARELGHALGAPMTIAQLSLKGKG